MESQQPQLQQTEKTEKLIWKKWWFWVIAVFVIIFIASAGGDDKKEIAPIIEKPTIEAEKEVAEETASTPKQVLQMRYEIYKEWQEPSGKLQQVIIIPTELRNESDLFAICDELNEKTKNKKMVGVRGFTNKAAADDTLLIDESPELLFQFSDKELETMNHHAVLAFDKLLLTPSKLYECNIYPQGYDYSYLGKTKKY